MKKIIFSAMLILMCGIASAQSVSYNDTLTADNTSESYTLGRKYSHVTVSVKYDSASVGNDTLLIYNIGTDGDTVQCYVLDSADNRVGYIVPSGDCVFKEYRIDVLYPSTLRFLYSDAVIYTTQWIIVPRAVNYK